ncbi:cytochrome b subunit of formate dehydrogenase [Chryseobacterium sp. 16F]|uniref:Cytochrome b subunit of formate dehydrogenase n=1 Tax=Frigoriflavimonas asaccharolytica TaxID=2735899 RepID=A0A8J8K7C8_9FLAO|nr:cytochrome b subunit of formate dehydrogenase [Frigoriflavimonas asaccharolytica]
MKTLNLEKYVTKNRLKYFFLIFSVLSLLYTGYVLFSNNYNDNPSYNFMNNQFGQFGFYCMLIFFIFISLKVISKEKLFPFFLVLLLLTSLILSYISGIFLYTMPIVFILSIFFFYTRKYLFYHKPIVQP